MEVEEGRREGWAEGRADIARCVMSIRDVVDAVDRR